MFQIFCNAVILYVLIWKTYEQIKKLYERQTANDVSKTYYELGACVDCVLIINSLITWSPFTLVIALVSILCHFVTLAYILYLRKQEDKFLKFFYSPGKSEFWDKRNKK